MVGPYTHMSCILILLINFVTRTKGVPEGVLIRAIEPEDGIEAMKANRGKTGYEITNGPGKWTKSFKYTKSYRWLNIK